MPKSYDPAQLAQVLVPLTAVVKHAAAYGYDAEDLVALLQAGRLTSHYRGVCRDLVARGRPPIALAEYVALFDAQALLRAQDLLNEQLARVRTVLVAMGELEAEDA